MHSLMDFMQKSLRNLYELLDSTTMQLPHMLLWHSYPHFH